MKIITLLFVDRNEDVVPLQCDSKTQCRTRHTTYEIRTRSGASLSQMKL